MYRHSWGYINKIHSTKEAFRNTNIPSLYDRRQELTTKLFKDIVNNPEHKLTDLYNSNKFSE
jgi:hypothetical protein